MTNIFRQARTLLQRKDAGEELTEEERQVIRTALIPFTVYTGDFFPEEITIAEGLEGLARLVEEADTEVQVEKTSPAQESHSRRGAARVEAKKPRLVAKAG